ncbi:MAG TPA: ribonuclease E activity regulator RraA [Methylococcaceae bacterium]|nr:ribonuclease E activity regulator RraA [Methylococcaceae bacterium]
MTHFSTADLCDRYAEGGHIQIAEPVFRAFGAIPAFSGPIVTLKVFEDNVLLRETLEGKSDGGVLVVDGGGSHRCALFGEDLARLAMDNGWSGIVVYGCIRDSAAIGTLPLGVRALHTHPLKSRKHGHGERDVLVTFAGVNFRTGSYLYADEDGLLVAPQPL